MASPEHRHRYVRGRRGHRARGGRAYPIRWSRPDANGGTRFTTPVGQPMTFARGPVWIVLTASP